MTLDIKLETPEDAMPWVGLYIGGASLLCTLAMAADAFNGFRQWKLWFPCKFFTINAVSITLIAIALKLPVDLTTKMPGDTDYLAKYFGVFFLVTMLANFLPSLGLMGDKELVTNIIALGILLVTITINVLIQSYTGEAYDFVTTIIFLIFPIVFLFSTALIVPTSRRILENRSHELDSASKGVNYSYEELTSHVKKSWMMTETGNPQFVIASSDVSYVFGILCSITAIISFVVLVSVFQGYGDMMSDYKWSMIVILGVQALGILIGSIATIFRCFTAITHFKISKSVKHLNMFKVEEYWTERLRHLKRIHVHSHIPGRHLKMVLNCFKNMILNLCIALQIMLVVICKTIALVPRFFLILLSCCCSLCMCPLKCCCSLCMYPLKICKRGKNACESEGIEEYRAYVTCLEEESQLSERLLRNTLNSITKLVHKSEKKEPSNLVKLLSNSKGFNGVLEFDDEQLPAPSEQNQNSWSLVAVTLTAIAIALPNIANNDVKEELIASMKEGLRFVRHIEENLNANTNDLVRARKVARRLWTEVEVYRKWLKKDLRNNARNSKTSKETLQWLRNEANEVVEKFQSGKNHSIDHSMHKCIAASSMSRISETILRHCDQQQNWQEVILFQRIATLNADILCACFTNLPRVIKMMCHHGAIEKREDGIQAAAKLLGKSKKILEILNQQSHLIPKDIDTSSIDKWRAALNHV